MTEVTGLRRQGNYEHPVDPGLLLKQLSKKTGGMYVEFLNTIEGLPEDDLKLLLVMARRLTGTSDEM